MICHQIEALKEAGCDEVVLAINYRPQVMMDFLKGWEEKLGIKITCSQEEEPMGTAGPLALAKDILNKDGKGAPFFVLNSDVICEYPLKEMMDQVRVGYSLLLCLMGLSDSSSSLLGAPLEALVSEMDATHSSIHVSGLPYFVSFVSFAAHQVKGGGDDSGDQG
jgi:hypothetical protein